MCIQNHVMTSNHDCFRNCEKNHTIPKGMMSMWLPSQTFLVWELSLSFQERTRRWRRDSQSLGQICHSSTIRRVRVERSVSPVLCATSEAHGMEPLGFASQHRSLADVSGPVVRPTDEARARCFTNGYLRIQHDHRRCNGIEMISSRSLNKSSLFRYFMLHVVWLD